MMGLKKAENCTFDMNLTMTLNSTLTLTLILTLTTKKLSIFNQFCCYK